MKNFIKGILFISLIVPILIGIVSILNQLVEYICMCLAVKTAKKQAEAKPEEEVHTHAIGFRIPTDEDCEEEGDW